MTNGAQRTLEEHGYRLILIDSGEDPETLTAAVQTLLDHEVDGILMSTAPVGAEQFNVLLDGTPCVFIDELAPGAGVGNVVLENERGMELLVDHIAGHGHTGSAISGAPTDRTSGSERLRGFVEAMTRNNLDVFPELIGECDWTIASGFAHARGAARSGAPAERDHHRQRRAGAGRSRGRKARRRIDPGGPCARLLRRPLLRAAARAVADSDRV